MGSFCLCIGFISALLLAITTNSKATEQLPSRQRGYGLVKFEAEQQPAHGQRQHGFISFKDQEYPEGNRQPFRFDKTLNYQEDHQSTIGLDNIQDNPISFGEANAVYSPEDGVNGVKTGVTFQNDNRIEKQKVQKKRKKRRRRRPRLQQLPSSGAYPGGQLGSGYPVPGSGYPVPGSGYPSSYIQNPYENPALSSGFHRPLRRPKSQLDASEALSAITGALASIARYDDYQCVPRLLCEAAGGGALGSGVPGTSVGSGLLQSVVALQPLLTLLSAYNGISASPLFIFGRAVFLGMTSRGTPGTAGAPATCRYAYPLCPTDPEQLVHYLNNHNGGFFRFFNAPQRLNPQYGLQQNLEQFYNQLAVPGQNPGYYGFYQPVEDLGSSPGQYFQNGQLTYPAPGAAQGYGLYNGVPVQQYDPNYQIPPSNGYQNYGTNYPYSLQNNGFAKVGFKDNERELKGVETNKIEKRIQNVKSELFQYDSFNSYDMNRNKHSKWLFPSDEFKGAESNKIEKRIQNVKSEHFEEESIISNDVDRNKHSKWLFPSENYKEDHAPSNDHSQRENKRFHFPKENFKTDHSDSNRKAKGFYFPAAQSNRDFYAYNPMYDSQTDDPQDGLEEEVEVVYIVRGDGDPKNPDIVKLRPGQTIQSIVYK